MKEFDPEKRARLDQIMVDQGFDSHPDLARAIDVPVKTLSKWFDRGAIPPSARRAFSTRFGYSLEWLDSGAAPKFRPNIERFEASSSASEATDRLQAPLNPAGTEPGFRWDDAVATLRIIAAEIERRGREIAGAGHPTKGEFDDLSPEKRAWLAAYDHLSQFQINFVLRSVQSATSDEGRNQPPSGQSAAL